MPRAGGVLAALAVALGMAAAAGSCAAMQFKSDTSDPTLVLITGRGEIIRGDLARLHTALAPFAHAPKLALLFDSPGGLVGEAEKMGHLIRDADLAVVIPDNSKCVSACFLLLAAAHRRFAASDALVGVHSASESGEETEVSMAVTTQMARIASDFDVPPAIIGKMVRTEPHRVEWLTHDDLVLMGVKILDDDKSPEPAPQRQAAIPQPAPLKPAPVRPAPLPSPAPAVAPSPLPSLRTPALVSPPATGAVAVNPVTIAEYQGAYFCNGPTTLSLKVMDLASGGGRRRAIFAFGPTATNPSVVRGAFVVEGRFDLGGGVLDMLPLPGTSQPSGGSMVGLVGRSDDGGRTFSGRVTANITCTLFTLRRVH